MKGDFHLRFRENVGLKFPCVTRLAEMPKKPYKRTISIKYKLIFVTLWSNQSQIMNNPKYQLNAEQGLTVFNFVSEGPKGRIAKLIEIKETNLKDFYNLAFGDKDEETGKINDSIVTNNNDTEKVLATVVSAVYAFTDLNPEAWVYATGSTESRTRLYRMGINKYLNEVENDFEIYGELGNNWCIFEKATDFEGFVVKRKNI